MTQEEKNDAHVKKVLDLVGDIHLSNVDGPRIPPPPALVGIGGILVELVRRDWLDLRVSEVILRVE